MDVRKQDVDLTASEPHLPYVAFYFTSVNNRSRRLPEFSLATLGLLPGAPEMPVFLKEEHVRSVVVRMTTYLIQVEISPNPWPLGEFKISVDDAGEPGQQIAFPRLVEVFEGLLQPGVRGCNVNVQTSQSANRTLSRMRNHRPIVSIHHVCNFSRAKNAAHMQWLNVKDINGIVP